MAIQPGAVTAVDELERVAIAAFGAEPGSVVIALCGGAAVNGSPPSGGYAGANATVRFITSYAAAESGRDALSIRFTSVRHNSLRKQA
jgi:hypothetical protein